MSPNHTSQPLFPYQEYRKQQTQQQTFILAKEQQQQQQPTTDTSMKKIIHDFYLQRFPQEQHPLEENQTSVRHPFQNDHVPSLFDDDDSCTATTRRRKSTLEWTSKRKNYDDEFPSVTTTNTTTTTTLHTSNPQQGNRSTRKGSAPPHPPPYHNHPPQQTTILRGTNQNLKLNNFPSHHEVSNQYSMFHHHHNSNHNNFHHYPPKMQNHHPHATLLEHPQKVNEALHWSVQPSKAVLTTSSTASSCMDNKNNNQVQSSSNPIHPPPTTITNNENATNSDDEETKEENEVVPIPLPRKVRPPTIRPPKRGFARVQQHIEPELLETAQQQVPHFLNDYVPRMKKSFALNELSTENLNLLTSSPTEVQPQGAFSSSDSSTSLSSLYSPSQNSDRKYTLLDRSSAIYLRKNDLVMIVVDDEELGITGSAFVDPYLHGKIGNVITINEDEVEIELASSCSSPTVVVGGSQLFKELNEIICASDLSEQIVKQKRIPTCKEFSNTDQDSTSNVKHSIPSLHSVDVNVPLFKLRHRKRVWVPKFCLCLQTDVLRKRRQRESSYIPEGDLFNSKYDSGDEDDANSGGQNDDERSYACLQSRSNQSSTTGDGGRNNNNSHRNTCGQQFSMATNFESAPFMRVG